MGLGKVWQNVYVRGIGLFSYLTYLHFWKKIVEGNKHRCVNKTSRDKGGACEVETVQSDIVGNYPRSKLPFRRIFCLNYPPNVAIWTYCLQKNRHTERVSSLTLPFKVIVMYIVMYTLAPCKNFVYDFMYDCSGIVGGYRLLRMWLHC